MENHDCPLIDLEIQPWSYRRRPLGFWCVVVAVDQVIKDLNLLCGKPHRAAGLRFKRSLARFHSASKVWGVGTVSLTARRRELAVAAAVAAPRRR